MSKKVSISPLFPKSVVFSAACLLFSTGQQIFSQSNVWQSAGLNTEGSIYEIAITDSDTLFATSYGKVFRCSASTLNWTAVDSGYTAAYELLAKSDSFVFVGSYNGVKRSLDGGANWTVVNNGITNTVVQALEMDVAGNLYAGGYLYGGAGSGVFKSTDNGGLWTSIGLSGKTILSIAIKENGTIFAGTTTGIYRTENGGASWDTINNGLTYSSIPALMITENDYVFAGDMNYGVYRSSNNGDLWEQVNTGLGSLFVACFAQRKYGDVFMASSYSDKGVYNTSDLGNQWYDFGLQDTAIVCLAVSSDNTLYAGTSNFGVYRIADPTAGIETPAPEQSVVTLDQNQPNPFSGETKISWYSNVSALTTVSIFDITGKKIMTVTEDEKPAGKHEAVVNAENMKPGLYYYSLQVGDYSVSGKMVVAQ